MQPIAVWVGEGALPPGEPFFIDRNPELTTSTVADTSNDASKRLGIAALIIAILGTAALIRRRA